jgi:hypothetical protein
MEPSRTGAQALIKLLAIIGFFAMLALIVWLLVQGVRAFPSVFSSLASIAETIQEYRPSELTIELPKNIVNSGETFTVNWTDMGAGTYEFTYVCTEGTSLSVRTDEGLLRDIACTDVLTLPDDVHGLFLTVRAGEQRFSDVDFTVTFDAKKGDTHIATGRVTVVNATMGVKPQVVATETAEVSTITLPPPTPVVPPSQPTPSRPAVSQPAASIVAFTPKSYESGFVDLRARYLGVGTIENGAFVPKATFTDDDTAAFRFEVKNIGTKTSDTWTYTLSLPGGSTYESDPQTGLTPNEKAVFTVGFELGDTTARAVTIGGKTIVKDDKDTSNDDFSWSVKVLN